MMHDVCILFGVIDIRSLLDFALDACLRSDYVQCCFKHAEHLAEFMTRCLTGENLSIASSATIGPNHAHQTPNTFAAQSVIAGTVMTRVEVLVGVTMCGVFY